MAKEEATIGIWNDQTLKSPAKLELLRKEMENYRSDLIYSDWQK